MLITMLFLILILVTAAVFGGVLILAVWSAIALAGRKINPRHTRRLKRGLIFLTIAVSLNVVLVAVK